MLLSILLPSVLGLSALQPAPLELLPGSSEAFVSGVASVQSFAKKKDWKSARQVADKLPDETITYTWESEGLSEEQAQLFAQSRDEAFAAWKEAIANLKFVPVKSNPEILFTFEPTLPLNADTVGPAGAVYFPIYAPNEPTLEAVIAQRRTEKKLPVSGTEIFNEVLYSVAAHLGLARTPYGLVATFRSEGLTNARNRVTPVQRSIAEQNMLITKTLRESIAKKVVPDYEPSSIFFDQSEVSAKPVAQGEKIPLSIAISNRGKGTLRVAVVPECSCLSVAPIDPLEPEQTAVMRIQVNTEEWPGVHDKKLYVYSNDPDQPLRILKVHFEATPRYRFLRPAAGQIWQVPEDGILEGLFLAIDPEHPLELQKPVLYGRGGGVEMKPWEGVLADPELREEAKPRKGYQFRFLVSPDVGLGRVPFTLEIPTTDPSIPFVRYSFYVQKGIAVMPSAVYFGELGDKPMRATITVSRPGKAFNITKLESADPRVKAKFDPLENGDFRITVLFNPDSPLTALNSTLKIVTDDPEQAEIVLPVSGRLP